MTKSKIVEEEYVLQKKAIVVDAEGNDVMGWVDVAEQCTPWGGLEDWKSWRQVKRTITEEVVE